ncbi:nucleotidyltransferase family protein [Natronincola ferrireducens]|uniref:MobA-like NTP transferase domain-containing protein n=1 Tax=Natronincola ferrireducens TaxID=393762 RepID=A0A1G9FD96_9FIRM|nr:nucleotidyltransferase family protein [Natronincola ferrireducens]SDK86173.1 MobA-like NTP transferase domain-containing protein [Natronincola ferrireducens]
MKAIILAGEGKKDRGNFHQEKALAPIKGIPMIQYIIKALRTSDFIDTILVIGNIDTLQERIDKDVDILVQQEASMMDNLLKALGYFKGEEEILIVTCDIPLINRDVVDNFIHTALALKVDIAYPIVEKSLCQKFYPQVKRTYVHLKDGSFTGGNMILLAPTVLNKIQQTARLMIENRKKPISMCRVLGFPFIIALLMRRLTILGLEGYIQKKFHIRAKTIISQDPEIANDIDKLEDILILEKYL